MCFDIRMLGLGGWVGGWGGGGGGGGGGGTYMYI